MINAIIAYQGGANGNTAYNIDQWNWLLQHVDSTQAPLDAASVGISRNADGSLPTAYNVTAAQYVALRAGVGLPVTLNGVAAAPVSTPGTPSTPPATSLESTLIAAAKSAGVPNDLNTDQWNYYLSVLFPGAGVVDPSQIGIGAANRSTTTYSAAQYVAYRQGLGLPINVSGNSLNGWGGMGGVGAWGEGFRYGHR
jgi:hypothetical protein